jgi:phenylalanyl-tRNA synthetase beta chain
VAIYNGTLIRRVSQKLNLRSDASRIFERGANSGGTVDALKRTAGLMLEYAGGRVASKIVDDKKEDFTPWIVTLNTDKMRRILGIQLPDAQAVAILNRLKLNPVLKKALITCTIPTYRGDIRIEEDLIEEIARLYGYNNFPKTLPAGQIPTSTVPYAKDYGEELKLKHLLTASGFNEIQTYSLISKDELAGSGHAPDEALRLANPVSLEYEYLRPNLKSSLRKALTQNMSLTGDVNLFEIGKAYAGSKITKTKEEYQVAGISNRKNYFEVKGILERIFVEFNVDKQATDYLEALNDGIYFSFPYALITEKAHVFRTYKPLPKYPAMIEDMSFLLPEEITTGEVINSITAVSTLIKKVALTDKYQNSRTFRITYQHPEKNLSTADIQPIRKNILATLARTQARMKT